MAGLGMEPTRLEQDLGAWRTEGAGKSVAMAGAATLQVGTTCSPLSVRSRCAGLGGGARWPDR